MPGMRRLRRAISLAAIGLSFCLTFLSCMGKAEATAFVEGPPSALNAGFLGSFNLSLKSAPVAKQAEPFGLATSQVSSGGVVNKWRGVNEGLRREKAILIACRTSPGACPPAAKRFLAVVDKGMAQKGRTRIAEINRAVNLSIRPVDDMTQYGVEDLWATPLMTFSSNAGDCEDYAIAKYVALREIGIALGDIRLVIVHDREASEDHAVTAVRYDGHWLILDNRTLDIREDVKIRHFNPLFVLDGQGVKRLVAKSLQMPTRAVEKHELTDIPELVSVMSIHTKSTAPRFLHAGPGLEFRTL
jgi:predicted transglutaminase-like cysteine proteinase